MTISIVVLVVVLLVVVIGGVVVYRRSRVAVPRDAAVVRTGWGGVTVVTDPSEPLLCLPSIHECHVVPFVSRTLSLEIAGDDYAATRDRVTVTCRADVAVSSLRDRDSILMQFSNEETGAGETPALDEILLGKCTSGIKRILSTRDFDDLSESLAVDDLEGLKPMDRLLAPQAYSTDSVVIDAIRMFDTELLDSTNVPHQETIRRRKENEQLERQKAMEREAEAATEALKQQINQVIAEQQGESDSRLATLGDSQQKELAVLSREQAEVESESNEMASKQMELQEQLVAESRNEILGDDENKSRKRQDQRARDGAANEAERTRRDAALKLQLEVSQASEAKLEAVVDEEMDQLQASSLQQADTRREQFEARNASESEQELAGLQADRAQALGTLEQGLSSQRQQLEEAESAREGSLEEARLATGKARAAADQQVARATERVGVEKTESED